MLCMPWPQIFGLQIQFWILSGISHRMKNFFPNSHSPWVFCYILCNFSFTPCSDSFHWMQSSPGSLPSSPTTPFVFLSSSCSITKAFLKHISLLFFCPCDFIHLQALNLYHFAYGASKYVHNLDIFSELSRGSQLQLFAPYLQPADAQPIRKGSMQSHGHALLPDFITSSLTSPCPMDFICHCKNNP